MFEASAIVIRYGLLNPFEQLSVVNQIQLLRRRIRCTGLKELDQMSDTRKDASPDFFIADRIEIRTGGKTVYPAPDNQIGSGAARISRIRFDMHLAALEPTYDLIDAGDSIGGQKNTLETTFIARIGGKAYSAKIDHRDSLSERSTK